MLARKITYTDFNDEERSETFYFNLTESELAKLEYSQKGGLTEWIKRATESKDGKVILDTFETIIKATYGVKSLDGRSFVKNDQVFEEFKGTNAYNQLFMELVTDAQAAAEFIAACMPEKMRGKAKEVMEAELKKVNTDEAVIKKVES